MRDMLTLLAFLVLAVALALLFGLPGLEAFREAEEPGEASVVERGRAIYVARCANCHGRLAQGTERGPALVGSVDGPVLSGAAAAHSAFGVDAKAAGRAPAGGLSPSSREALAASLRELGRAKAR